MKKIWVIALAAAILALMVFISCSGKPAADNKLHLRFMYWGDVEEIRIINDTIARFEAANPTIKIDAERAQSGNPYMEKVIANVAAETAADVIFVSSDDVVKFAANDWLLPLNTFVTTNKFPIKKYNKGETERYTVDGKLFIIPRDIAPVACLYYNKKLFEKAKIPYPKDNWTWADLVKAGKKLTLVDKATGKIVQYGLCDDWNLYDGFIAANGGSYVDNIAKPTKCTMDTKNAINAIKFRQDLVYKYKIMPNPTQLSAIGGVGTSEMFLSGQVAMFFSGIWKTPMFRKITEFDWDISQFPKGPDTKQAWFVGGGSGYGIMKTSKHQNEAWQFVTYLAGEEGQKQLAQTGLAQPAITEMASSKYFLDDQKPQNKKMLIKAANYIIYTPFTPMWSDMVSTVIGPELDGVWMNTNKESVAVVCKRIAKKINEKYYSKKK